MGDHRRGPPPARLGAAAPIAANHPVPAGRLAEACGTAVPPTRAATTLHSYISRLRGLVGTDRITTEAGGYTLRVGDGELDAWVFETEATVGRTALRDGDPAPRHADRCAP
jgi:DNA-binding SARP family transcriptional activator